MIIRAIQVILLLTAFSLCGMAQPYVSKYGKFQVNQVTGCDTLTVNITVLPPFSCATSSCDVHLGGENDEFITLNPPHIYATPGTYWMQVLIGNSPIDSIMITVLPDIPPAFNLYSCGNNRVTVDVTDTNYDEYVVSFNDGSPDVTIPPGTTQHTYSSSGTKSVTVRGRNAGAADNCSSATQNVAALTSLPTPTLTRLEVLDNTSLQLDLNTQPNILYRLEIATNSSTNFQLLKTLYNVTSDVLTNLRPDDSYYCFRIGAFNPCTNTTSYSTIMCSANFDLSVENNTNNLTWATQTSGFSNIRLERTTTGNALTTTVTGTTYSDTDIICGTEYCYQLTTTYPGGGQSISLEKCGTAFSTDAPSPVFNISAVVGEPGVNIHWQLVPGFNAEEFLVYRSLNGANTEIGRTTNLQLYDEAYLTENEACYYVAFRDVCQNVSALSAAACPIRLTGKLGADNTITLTWSAYSAWRDGTAGYSLEQYTLDGQLLQVLDAGQTLSYTDNTTDLDHQGYIFVVKARPVEPGLVQSVSNRVIMIKDPNLFYPTGFTPNGDNLNDLFNVYGQYIVAFEMNIFNRWGELLFTTTNLEQGWDGSFKGNAMPEGTYTFVADITDVAGRSFRKSGTVLLIRKGN